MGAPSRVGALAWHLQPALSRPRSYIWPLSRHAPPQAATLRACALEALSAVLAASMFWSDSDEERRRAARDHPRLAAPPHGPLPVGSHTRRNSDATAMGGARRPAPTPGARFPAPKARPAPGARRHAGDAAPTHSARRERCRGCQGAARKACAKPAAPGQPQVRARTNRRHSRCAPAQLQSVPGFVSVSPLHTWPGPPATAGPPGMCS